MSCGYTLSFFLVGKKVLVLAQGDLFCESNRLVPSETATGEAPWIHQNEQNNDNSLQFPSF